MSVPDDAKERVAAEESRCCCDDLKDRTTRRAGKAKRGSALHSRVCYRVEEEDHFSPLVELPWPRRTASGKIEQDEGQQSKKKRRVSKSKSTHIVAEKIQAV